jgi:competence protein ComEC
VTLIYLSCAWVAGIWLGFNFSIPLFLISIGLIPLPLLFLKRYTKPVMVASLCLFAFFGAAVYSQSGLPADNESHISFYNDQPVTIKGMVSQDPDVRDKNTQLRLSDIELETPAGWRRVTGDALLFVSRYPVYSYGDILLVTGELETPPRFEDFDYADYLAHESIYSTMLYPQIETLDTGQGFKPLEWLYAARNELSHVLAEVLPEPQASLAQGIVLGIRGNIPADLQENFSITGTAHLLAISGLHLSIVAGLMLSIGIWLFGRRRYLHIWLALSVIWLYALLTGMHPPVVRGAIMASVFLTAELLGRQRSAITALTFAAAIMVGVEPQVLFAASFQMSFLAMAGIILIFPQLQDWGRNTIAFRLGKLPMFIPIAGLISDGFMVTLAAVITVWPVIAHYFGIVSLVGPLATFLALPAIPGIIAIGALTAGLGLIALPLAQVSGWLVWTFLSYLLLVVNGFAALPLSHIDVGSFTTPLIWVYYPLLAVVLWLITRRRRAGSLRAEPMTAIKPVGDSFSFSVPKKWLVLPLVVIVALVSVAVAAKPDDRLHVFFFDVGQGDAILIQKGNQQLLVDGGPSPQAITLELSRQMPFWDRTIELVVLTHPHADHITGLVEVLDKYKMEQVLSADLESDLPIYDEWLSLIEEKNIKCTTACAGQQITMGDVVIDVLNPPQPLLTGTDSDIDNNGVVLQVAMGEVSFLLMADVMWQSEFELISRRAVPQSTVLKVGHHGSDTSTTAEFLAVVCPRLAVISADPDEYGHPSDDVIARLEAEVGSDNIYCTYENGTIEFITDGHRLWLEVGE